MKQTLPIGVLGWTFLVIVASFLSWGTFQATMTSPIRAPLGFPNPFSNMPVAISMTGWQGHLNLANITLPNWLVVIAAIVAAALFYIRHSGLGEVNRNVCIALVVYGIAHVALLIFILAENRATIGVGALLTLVGLVGMLVALFKTPSLRQPAGTPS